MVYSIFMYDFNNRFYKPCLPYNMVKLGIANFNGGVLLHKCQCFNFFALYN